MRLREPSPAVLAVFLALLIQAFVVQPHIHFDTNWGSFAALLDAGDAQIAAHQPALPGGDDVDHCPICREQMSGGRTLILHAAQLQPPNAEAYVALYATALCAAYGIISHSWQGRGPPVA